MHVGTLDAEATAHRTDGLTVTLGTALMSVAVVGGAASVLASSLLAPAAFEAAEIVSAAAPWAALATGALVARLCAPLRRRAMEAPTAAASWRAAASLALGPLAAGVGAWFSIASGLPLLVTQVAGSHVVAEARVLERLADSGPGCEHRLVLASAVLPHSVAVCVDPETWAHAAEGGPLTIEVMRSTLGLEIRPVLEAIPTSRDRDEAPAPR
jgi:hypothetical protein